MTEQMRSSNQALATAIQQLATREPRRDRPVEADNKEEPTTLTGESETLRTTVLDVFPVANPKLVCKIITKELSLWWLWIRKTASPLSNRCRS